MPSDPRNGLYDGNVLANFNTRIAAARGIAMSQAVGTVDRSWAVVVAYGQTRYGDGRPMANRCPWRKTSMTILTQHLGKPAISQDRRAMVWLTADEDPLQHQRWWPRR